MKPAPFQYHAPTTISEVVAALDALGEEAKVLAGGQSLVPMLNLRLARFEHLVDIGRVAELRGVERVNGHVSIGAATRDVVIERATQVARDVPLLAAATPYIGHFQIRNRGTIGGSLSHADPAAEYPAVALALEATFHATSVRGARAIPAAEFFDGVWSTALARDELLISIDFPVWSGRCGFGVAEFARRHGDFAIAGAVAGVELDGERVVRAALALFGVAGVPLRLENVEQAVLGRAIGGIDPVELGALAFEGIDDVTDEALVPQGYRRRVGAAMVADAWQRAVADAQDGAGNG